MLSALRPFACAAYLMSSMTSVFGATLRVEPFVSVEGVYTDNVTLAPNNRADSELILQVAPGVSAMAVGGRSELEIDYVMHNVIYESEQYEDRTYHRFEGRGQLEMVSDTAFVDVGATRAQRTTDPVQASTFDRFSITDNRTEVTTTRVSPFVRNQIGTAALTELRYARERVAYDQGALERSDSDKWQFAVGSLDPSSTVTWRTTYDRERLVANRTVVRFESAQLELGYQATGRARLLGVVGSESNEFLTGNGAAPEGRFWKAGAQWQLTSRSEVFILVGERYFGNTYEGRWLHRGSKGSLGIRYSETLTTAAHADLTALSVLPETDPLWAEISAEVYVQKRFGADVSFQAGKIEAVFSAIREQREYAISDDVDVIGGDAKVSWRVRPRTTASAELVWRSFYGRTEIEDYTQTLARVGANQSFTSTLSGHFYISRANRFAEFEEDEFTQHSIHVGIAKRFR